MPRKKKDPAAAAAPTPAAPTVPTLPVDAQVAAPTPSLLTPGTLDAPLAVGESSVVPSSAMWAQMQQVAQTLMSSGLLPEKLKGSLERLMIVLLKAWELKIPLLTAVRQIYITDDGQLALQAEAQRALIERSGLGYIQLEAVTPEEARATAVRYGLHNRPDRTVTLTYTLAELVQAGGDRPKWPADQLAARVTSRLARQVFGDVVQGLGYDPSELTRGEPAAPAPTPAPMQMPPAAAPAAPPPSQAAPVAPQVPQAAPAAPTPTQPPTPAVEAPQAAPAAPTAPAAPVAPAAPQAAPVQAAPPALTHPVEIPQTDGTVKVKMTAGITKDQIMRVLSLTSANSAYGEKLMKVAKDFMAVRGMPSIAHCDAAQGGQLVALLESVLAGGDSVQTAAQTPPPAAPAKPLSFMAAADGPPLVESILEQLLEKHQIADRRDAIIAMLCQAKHVGSLAQINPTEAAQMLREIDDLGSTDLAALKLAVDRFMGDGRR